MQGLSTCPERRSRCVLRRVVESCEDCLMKWRSSRDAQLTAKSEIVSTIGEDLADALNYMSAVREAKLLSPYQKWVPSEALKVGLLSD